MTAEAPAPALVPDWDAPAAVRALVTARVLDVRRGDGTYPAGTVNRLAEDRLRTFNENARKPMNGKGAAQGPLGVVS